MRVAINPEYKNQINTVAIGNQHNVQLYTDRPLTPGDGTKNDLLNYTITGSGIGERDVYSDPGSGSFNP
jgi:hypothetical protein